MKVKLLRRIRKHWKIYENPNWSIDKGFFRYYAYRNGKIESHGDNLHSLKLYTYEREAIAVLFWSFETLEKRKLKRKKGSFKKKLVQVYP